ncbi:MAG: protein translocase subunit SecD [Rhodospirillaceae bacterium]|nr:protein translocase subunit SecD [Rhodospirillaceae bacterium]
MLEFGRGKIITVIFVVIFGFVFAAPNLMTGVNKEELPSWWQPVNLGLDLRGGSYLLMEVGIDAVRLEQFTDLQESTRQALRDAKIGYRNLAVRDQSVTLALPDPTQIPDARRAIAGVVPDVQFENQESGRLRITLSEQVLLDRQLAAVTQSIEIVRRRVDEFGTSEASIQRQGADRIIVELPGIDDPQRVVDLIGRTAKLNFHMMAPGFAGAVGSVQDIPAGSIAVPAADGSGGFYVVQRRTSVPGEMLVDSQPSFQDGQPVVSFRFNTQGGRRFGAVTSQNVGQNLAILLDGEVISAPRIRSAIVGGSGIIEGGFTIQGAQDLALLLRAGALPAPLKVLEERSVGPGLGADSIEAGEFASVLGLILVAIFMAMVYGLFGVFSVVALVVNLVLILGALSVIGATLTLPGIAGIVLTVGMAVDANVLIYERMREEAKTGRTLFNALDSGFKQAFKTIIDSNLTTLIAALLLFWFGSGPVKGFAVTLGLGIISTLFTATMVSRLIVITWVRRTKPQSLPISPSEVEKKGLFTPLISAMPQDFNLDFIGKRKIAAVFSVILIAASIGSFAVQRLNFGIDFAGGILMEVRADQPVEVSAVRAQVGGLGLGDVSITTFGEDGRDLLIRIQKQEGDDEAQATALSLVRETLGDSYEYRRTELVGPKVGQELILDGALAVALALLAICVYIWFRFEWQFAAGATLALTHDVLATIGMFSIFQMEFNLTTVAAVLTIAGYSINDTVVAYDRVREQLRKFKKLPLPELVNMAVNRVLSRTLLTSLTTLLAVTALSVFGGEVLRGFSIALMWGVVVGTYSSIYVAMPVLIYFDLRHEDLEGGAAPNLAQVPEHERT